MDTLLYTQPEGEDLMVAEGDVESEEDETEEE